MALVEFEQSRLTEKNQATVPAGVRRHLNVGKGDRIAYKVERNGRVYIEPVVEAIDGAADPAMSAFLGFLEKDLIDNPDRLKAFDGGLLARMQDLVGDVEIDLDAPLSDDDE